MRKNWLINRRTCLKGLGVSLALPLLETMGWADSPKGNPFKFPVRLGFMYMPLGVNQHTFWPKSAESFSNTLPSSLEPLRPVISDCLLLDGINNADRSPYKSAPHWIELASWLTATIPNPEKPSIVNIAPSADQIAASHLGLYTPIPSLELGYKEGQSSGTGQEGLSNIYMRTASYRNATQPIPYTISPQEVFKRLFAARSSGGGQMSGGPDIDISQFMIHDTPNVSVTSNGPKSLDRSMLDLIQESGKNLRKKVSLDDQHQLDDYLDSVRNLEKRVVAIERQRMAAAQASSVKNKSTTKIERSPPLQVNVPSGEVKWSDHIKVMGDLMVLAFQTDQTRVGTLITSFGTGLSYDELPFNDKHHEISHHEKDQAKFDKLSQIDRFNIEQYAYIIQRMRSLKEGGGTLLDNVMFMWGSGLGDGQNHTNKRIPVIIAGRGGGTVRTGRYVKASGNNGDLLSAMLVRAGVPLDKPIGCGTKLLPDLS